MGSSFDVITMGRIGLDLYPQQLDVPLSEVETFVKAVGGSPTNVAVAAAKLGCTTAVITKVGDDPFGEFLRRGLDSYGVDTRWVGVHPSLRTPLAFCAVHPPDHFPLLFYREPSAPDLTMEQKELSLQAIRAARVFWTTGTGLSVEPSRSATLAALAARREADGVAISIHDLDYRPSFWDDRRSAARWSQEALSLVTVAVGNQDEVSVATGTRDPADAAKRLLEMGPKVAIVKCGGDGVLARSGDLEIAVPAVPLPVVNGLGAGDGFGGALAFALASGWDFERAIRLANAAGAIVASRLLCADATPTLAELEELLGEAVA